MYCTTLFYRQLAKEDGLIVCHCVGHVKVLLRELVHDNMRAKVEIKLKTCNRKNKK